MTLFIKSDSLLGTSPTITIKRGGEVLSTATAQNYGRFLAPLQGRVSRIDSALVGVENADAITVLSQPERGRAFVNGAGDVVLDLVGEFVRTGNEWQVEGTTTGEPITVSFDVEVVTGAETVTKTVEITAPADAQRRGWGVGAHYQLPHTQAPGESVAWDVFLGPVGWGPIYVTSKPSGWTRAMIAADAAVTEGTVNATWLLDRLDLYGTEAKPYAMDTHNIVSSGLRNTGSIVLWERGGDYTGWTQTAQGYSALHPIYVGAWGTGAKPIMPKAIFSGNTTHAFSVRQDLDMLGLSLIESGVFHALVSCDWNGAGGLSIQGTSYVTMDGCKASKLFQDMPNDGATTWAAHRDRAGGSFVAKAHHYLLADSMYNQCGFEEGFNPDGVTWNNGEFGHPPNLYSHNPYLQADMVDTTIRNLVTSRASSLGYQMRAGGVNLGTLSYANPVAGNDNGQAEGRVVIGTGHRSYNHQVLFMHSADWGVQKDSGACGWGFRPETLGITLDAVVAMHRKDPDQPSDTLRSNSWGIHNIMSVGDDYAFRETGLGSSFIDYNWAIDSENLDLPLTRTPPGVDTDALDVVTIGRWYDQKVGNPPLTTKGIAGSAAVADYLLTYPNPGDAAREVNRWVLEQAVAAGAPGNWLTPERTGPDTVNFRPNLTIETPGCRTDIRRDWTSEDIPGLEFSDTVLLDGYTVHCSQQRLDWASLDLGGGILVKHGGITEIGAVVGANGGVLRTRGSGRLDVASITATGISVQSAGGLMRLMGAATLDRVDVAGERCRFDNMEGIIIADIVNAALVQIDANITAADVQVGSKGDIAFGASDARTARLTITDSLTFTTQHQGVITSASAPEPSREVRFGGIREMRTLGVAPNVVSEVSIDGADIVFDLGAVTAAFTQDLIDVDLLTGTPASIAATNNAAWNITTTLTGTTLTIAVAAGTGLVNGA